MMVHVPRPNSYPIEMENDNYPFKQKEHTPCIIPFEYARRALAKRGLLPIRRRIPRKPMVIQFEYACRMLAKKTALLQSRRIYNRPSLSSFDRTRQQPSHNQRVYGEPIIIQFQKAA